jgi:hypothetical protein
MRFSLLAAVTLTAAALQAADPTLLNLVMPDAKVLAGINVQKAKTTPFGQFLLTQMPVGDPLNSFIAATGFDPRQDLTEVLIASDAAAKSTGLVLARGTFNPAQIAAAVAKDGKHTAQTYNGAQLITANSATDSGAVAFLSGSIAIAGDLASVKSAIDRSSGNNAIDPGLAAKVAGYAATDAWSVSIAPINFGGDPAAAAANPLSGALKSIQTASGSIMLSSPVQITAQALADSDQDATSLSDVLKFAAMMMQGQNTTATSMLNGLNVTTDHSTINIQLSIPEDQLEQLIQNATKPSADKAAKKRVAAHV